MDENEMRLLHLVNLMSIAFVDGEIADDERDILIWIAQEMGLTEEEYNSCVDYWKKTVEENIPIAIPKDDEDQIEYLKHFALVMMIDGQLADNEKGYLAHVAEQFGYNAEKLLPALIEDVYHEYFEEDEEEEDDIFDETDDELQLDMGKMKLQENDVEGAFDELFLPALRNAEAAECFMIIPNINSRLFRLTPEQIEKVEEAADKGYPLAIYVLGRYYQVMKIEEQEGDWLPAARHLLGEAANAGIADAHWAMAMLYLLGYEGPVVFDHYRELINKAFDNGSMQAFKQKLHDTIYGIHGFEADPKTAIRIIEDFLSKDEVYTSTYPDILDLLGEAYRIVGNKDKSDKCFETAQDHGFFEAGAHRFENRTEGPDRDFYRETLSVILDFACDNKDPNSFMSRALEDIYHHDKEDCPNPKDYQRKLKDDLEMAYTLGNGDAAYLIGHCYYYGNYGYEENNQEAWNWYTKGQEMESGLAYWGMAQMIEDENCPEDLPGNYLEFCRLAALRRGITEMLPDVVEAYKQGKLNNYAEEIEKNYLPLLDLDGGDPNIPTVLIVKHDGKATIYHLEKEDWHKLSTLIGAKRLAPLRIDALDKIGNDAGFGDHLVAWTDIDAPRKGLGLNSIASSFFPGVVAGDIVFSLADNLYDPMPFFGIEEAKRAIDALGATLEGEVEELSDMVDLCVPQREIENKRRASTDYSKVNPFVDKGYVARIEPDGKAYIVDTSTAVFALFEEDIYDPARLDSLNELGKKLGIKGRLTIWTDNAAYRKQMVMYDKVEMNAVGVGIFPGPVVDNFYLALEDEGFRLSVFNNLEQLKKALAAIGIESELVISEWK